MTTIETQTDFVFGGNTSAGRTPLASWRRGGLLTLGFAVTLGTVYAAFASIEPEGQRSVAPSATELSISATEHQLSTTTRGDHLFLLGSDMVVFSNHIDIAWSLLGSQPARSFASSAKPVEVSVGAQPGRKGVDGAVPALVAHL